MRQAFAGMLWSKQLYYYDVARWLDGDPTQPRPPASRLAGRNARWRSFDAFDIMSMPDKWEYPWFAAWDLAFHCVALAHVDPAFAKYQLLLLCREWFQHPNGALPAYEWDFGDVNPPVQAWAALEVFAIDGGRDLDFLSQVFDKLLVNFTWWVNREDADGSNLFEGGFLGLDNIGPLDRSHLPVGGDARAVRRHRLDGVLRAGDGDDRGRSCTAAAAAGRRPRAQVPRALRRDPHALWASRACGTTTDGLFYDRLVTPDGDAVPVEVRSMVGIIPMLAAAVIDEAMLDRAAAVGKQFAEFLDRAGPARPRASWPRPGCCGASPGHRRLLLGVVGIERLERLFEQAVRPRASSCRRTACGRCPPTTASTRTSSRSRGCGRRSTTSRPSRPPRCSAATPTGAARCGSR